MKIEELDDSTDGVLERSYSDNDKEKWLIPVGVDAKRALVGAGARILFYPTLYNNFRNKIQAEFRWWDQLDRWLSLRRLSMMMLTQLSLSFSCLEPFHFQRMYLGLSILKLVV